MKVKFTPQKSFISILCLAAFSFTGYFSTSVIDSWIGQEPVIQEPKVQQVYVNGTPSGETLKSEMPLVTVHPNPFYEDYFFLTIMPDNPDFEHDDYRVVVYDVLGKMVNGHVAKIGRNTLPAQGYAPGIYFVNVLENEKVIRTVRLVRSN